MRGPHNVRRNSPLEKPIASKHMWQGSLQYEMTRPLPDTALVEGNIHNTLQTSLLCLMELNEGPTHFMTYKHTLFV